MEATHASDCGAIIKAFEKHLLSAPSEGGIIGTVMPKLAAISSNSTSSAAHLENSVNPPIPQEILGAFNQSASQDQEPSVNIPGALAALGAQVVDIKNWQQWLASCIPCALRIEFRAELLNRLDDQLLDILEEMVNQYLKQLAFILNLLNATDVYADVCPLLAALSDTCIPDLQRILSLLAAILYRISVRELTGLDLMKLLILPIFQPIFSGLIGILNQYKTLVTDPLNCVVANLNAQLGKLQTGSTFNESLARDLTEKADALGLISGEAQKAETFKALNEARQPFTTIDEGITAMQDAAGMAVFHLRRLMLVGIFEIESLLDELKSELASFLGINDKETVEFLLNQYQKLLIFRMIAFISALVKALTVGFNCNFNDPAAAEDTVGKFLNDFLGPNAPIIVRNDSVTGEIQLLVNPAVTDPLKDSLKFRDTPILVQAGVFSTLGRAAPQSPSVGSVITPTGNKEVDSAFDAIMTQSSQAVTIKPRCVFEPGEVDSNKLAQWIAELNATGA
jgi:hypothetical protein